MAERWCQRRWLVTTGLAVVLLVFGLFAVLQLNASPMNPTSWRPTPVLPVWTTRFVDHASLSNPRRFGCAGRGPEAIAVNPRNGDLATGFSDGKILLISGLNGSSRIVANTHGVPLGIGFLKDSTLVVADAKRGLLRINSDGSIKVLSTASGKIPIHYADGLVVDTSGQVVYLTDVSSQRGSGDDLLEIVEHRGTGRLLRFDTITGQTSTLLSGLQFANGVALGPHDAYILVAETGAYRIRQYWLSGSQIGKAGIFVDGLPGFPDNITFNGRDTFWIGIHNPRLGYLDALAPFPALRKLIFPLLSRAFTSSDPGSRAVAINLSGSPVISLQGDGPGAYAPITEAREVGSQLVLGSDFSPCLASIPRPAFY